MYRIMLTILILGATAFGSFAEDNVKPKLTPSAVKSSVAGGKCCEDDKCCETEKSASRVFELRTYYTNENKLTDLHKRFRDHTCSLLKKHGAELVGFWTPQDEKDGKGAKLVYLVAFPSREAARKAWKEFGEDPTWKKVYAESHKNGKLVSKVESVFLDPTDYSAIK